MKIEKGDPWSANQLSVRDIQGDMGEKTRMNLTIQQDGDVVLGLTGPDAVLDIEFTTHQGGSHNPEIAKKLRELARSLAGEAYPEAPRQYTAITGDDHIMEEQTGLFFDEILSILGYGTDNMDARQAFCRIELFNLGKNRIEDFQDTDEIFRILKVQDRTVASVFLRRTQFNYNEVSFASYLNPQLADMLKFRIPT